MNKSEVNDIRKTYRSELAQLRLDKGFSLRDITKQVGIPSQTLHNWENGTNKQIGPKYKREAIKLAKLYSISVEELNSLVNKAWIGFKKQTSRYKGDLTKKNYLFELRINNFKTLQQVANATGTSISLILQYEKGLKTPTAEILKTLSNYYNVPYETLCAKILSK